MFDVNSLGGKLIDNQNLKKALENGGGGGGNIMFVKLIKNDDTDELSCETSIVDIYNAWAKGKFVYLRAFNYYPDAPEEYQYEADPNQPCYMLHATDVGTDEHDMPDPNISATVYFEYVGRNDYITITGRYTQETGEVWAISAS